MIEELLSKEIFSNVQEVVKEIIQGNKCQTVTGTEFYERLLSKFGFFTRLLISPHQEIIINTFDMKIDTVRSEINYLKNLCSSATDENVNKFILLFLKDQLALKKSWENYLASSKPRGGYRKTRISNKKKTKKIKRMKYK